jgi:transglutaminase-like putative cysteine protease
MNCCRIQTIFVAFSFAVSALTCFGDAQEIIGNARRLSDDGDFKQAANVLIAALRTTDGSVSLDDKKEIEFQLDVLGRIRKDYSYTEKELYAAIDESLTGLTKDEFSRWVKDDWFDSRTIDGKRYFVGTSVSNLYWRHPELNARRRVPKNTAEAQKRMLENARAIKTAAIRENTPYVLPHRYKATMTVTAEKNAAPAGQIIRAWLPFPRKYPFQKEIKLLGSSSRIKYLADENSPIRSAYLEQEAKLDKPTKFQISFEFTIHCQSFPLIPAKIQPVNAEDPALKPYLSEAPHVVFTDKIKALAEHIAGDQTNQMLEAQAFYNWIAENIKYSYSREYSTLTNISDYCMSNRYGDCGQEALLFITLCRSRGIPARWQTGWHLTPGSITIHDWTEIYLAPYGWVPVDPWAGIHAMRYCTALKPEERRELRDFYFGGLDQWRMIANCDHNQKLQPPKNTFRSDDVDFQRGELESGDENIYFDKYSYHIDVEELKPRFPK